MSLEVVNSAEKATKFFVAPTLTSITWRVDVFYHHHQLIVLCNHISFYV